MPRQMSISEPIRKLGYNSESRLSVQVRKFGLFGYTLACVLVLALYTGSFTDKRHWDALHVTEYTYTL